jgi:hypothetical protein
MFGGGLMKINISKRMKAASPHKGFGKPRRVLQTIWEGEGAADRFDGFNGSDEKIRDVAIALLQLSTVEIVLVLDGEADISDVKSDEIFAEYRRDDTGKGDQVVLSARLT